MPPAATADGRFLVTGQLAAISRNSKYLLISDTSRSTSQLSAADGLSPEEVIASVDWANAAVERASIGSMTALSFGRWRSVVPILRRAHAGGHCGRIGGDLKRRAARRSMSRPRAPRRVLI